ncbi:MAG: glycosyltransferase [Candidatus Micrarchaeia archaeon]
MKMMQEEKVYIIKEVKNPKVSVIVPTLNEERYIEKTLLSIKNQMLNFPIEIIVSDGKSNDKTVKIAKKYANKIIIYNKRSPAIQRNMGAKYAKGEYLIFVDADTILLPNTIQEILKVLKKKNVSLVACPIFPIEYKLPNFFLFWFFNQFSKTSIKTKKPQIVGIIMGTKKKDFLKVKGFDEKKNIFEDYDFSEKISKIGKISIVNSTFVLTSSRRIEKWSKTKNVRSLISYFTYLFTGKGIGKYEIVR